MPSTEQLASKPGNREVSARATTRIGYLVSRVIALGRIRQ